ncbi:hypothetical protein [Gloeocapsopsis dulcis]|uniref:Uncharacterized protein n=1 Tax=Gloeocapsopsis dulcis AAB1 = 1H9 TaxID=1433147 RepID=A0A6N8FZF4_9CHRO|nr:hypothetical protein [Gloeocapsopsis dulcis]MUL37705.1 hypothetical protein [Gloeocapsopsis dulcis AAB1 = 1H9]WNN88465.1 hypothetical protein P0S91_19590 [Gloeocapsopsis dulcis]
MKNANFPTSACRYCRYYQPEGRRGGCCQMLGVPVQGSWKACELSLPAFAPSWESLKKVMIVPDEPALVPKSSRVFSESNHASLEPSRHSLSLASSPPSLTPS